MDNTQLKNKVSKFSLLLSDLVNILEEETNNIKGLSELKDKKDKLDKFKFKLDEGKLELAFIGKEKMGKSSLVNAYIGQEVLPSARERATYIPTSLEKSNKLSIEIEFYSIDEYIKKFQHLLKDVGFNEYDKQTPKTLTKRDIEAFFKTKKEEEEHYSSKKNSINEMIDGYQGEARKFLNLNKVSYDIKDSNDQKEKFGTYITDPYISRAVKKVTIKTPNIPEKLIAYDLPGFDSTIFEHEEYAIKWLRMADVIIFIREADKPSITGTEIKLLNTALMEDGTAVKDKTFYVMNKADMLKDKDEVEKIKSSFFKELKSSSLSSSDKIVFCSSIACLGDVKAQESMTTLGFYECGIKELQDKIESFASGEGVKIFERRVNTLIQQICEHLKSIHGKLSETADSLQNNITGMNISELYNKFDELFKYLETLYNEEKNIVLKDKPFEKKLRNNIALVIPEKIENDLKITAKRDAGSKTTTLEERPDEYNKIIRTDIANKIRLTFRDFAREEIEKHINSFKEKLIENLSTLSESPSYKNHVAAVINKEMNTTYYYSSSIDSIIYRFIGDFIDIISAGLHTEDRKNKFKEVSSELYSLSAYNALFDYNDLSRTNNELTYILLKGDMTSDQGIETLKSKLDPNLSKNLTKEIAIGITKEVLRQSFPWYDYIEAVIQAGINADLKKLIEVAKHRKQQVNIDEIDLHSKAPNNYDDVDKEIEEELIKIKYIFNKYILRAVNLEKVYINLLKNSKETLSNNKNDIRTQLISENKIDPEFAEKQIINGNTFYKITNIKNKINNILKELGGI